MVRESPQKNSKNVCFRPHSLIKSVNTNQHHANNFRSLSPTGNTKINKNNQTESQSDNSDNNENVYFAQAIGHGRILKGSKGLHLSRPTTPAACNIYHRCPLSNLGRKETTAERIMEIHSSPVRNKDNQSKSLYYSIFINK